MAAVTANPHKKRAILLALVLGVPLVAVGTVNFISELLDSNDAAIVGRPLATVGVSRAGVFSPNGRLLLTADQRGVHWWDATTWRELGRLSPPFVVNSAVLSADGARLAILGDAQTWILNREDAQVLAKISNRVEAAAFSADGTMLQTFNHETPAGAITTWDVASGQRLRTLPGSTALPKPPLAAFSSDGTRLAVVSTQQNILIRSAHDGTDAAALTVPTDLYLDSATALQFSPDRSGIVVVGPDETARVVDAANGQRLKIRVSGIQFLPCESSFAVPTSGLETISQTPENHVCITAIVRHNAVPKKADIEVL